VGASSVRSVGTILVAAGGGGDAITAAALRRPLDLTEPMVIMTYSWDRLMIDPLPGPRSSVDFTGLRWLGQHVAEVLPETRPTPPAGSSLPRLAGQLPARLLLLDPIGGAVGMADQLTEAAAIFGADALVLVDVGGDSLTNGTEPGLRSPLADQLAIAACLRSGIPTRLVVAAAGIDGELDPATVIERLTALGAEQLLALASQDLAPIRDVLAWHPSEATGLFAAAADGRRGCVEVRDAGDQVELTDDTARLYAVPLAALKTEVPAAALLGTRSLAEAEATLRELTGISEIQYETAKVARRNRLKPHTVTVDDLHRIDEHSQQAAARGSAFISMRRLSELVGATTLESFVDLGRLLGRERSRQYLPPVYSVN
jgi:hypothetical protein